MPAPPLAAWTPTFPASTLNKWAAYVKHSLTRAQSHQTFVLEPVSCCFKKASGASLYVPGSSRIHADYPGASLDPDRQSTPEHLHLLQDPKWGQLFDRGFHCDRGGTVPLAMLTVFLQAKIALTFVQPAESTNKVVRLRNKSHT